MATATDASAAASAACEVVEGARESALRLLALLQAMGADPGRQKLAEQIIRSIDRALAAVRGAGDVDKQKRRSKRRATCGRGETGARVVSATTDDGFAWRKYGEKVINHHRFRRFYFRCTYRDEHGCSAKKQVQQTQDDPALFETTYFGKHTAACPRDNAPLAVAECAFVVSQAHFPTGFRPCAAGNSTSLKGEVPSLPAGEKALMLPDVPECSEIYWPVEDRLMKFVSADCSYPSPARVESFDDSLEELVSLLWS